MGSVLADPPAWGVAAVAGTYAAVGHPDVDDPVLPPATVPAEFSDIPLLLVLPEYDFEWIVTASAKLLDRCAAEHRAVDVIEVPGGHHGFETIDDTDEVRDAVRRSIAWWVETLRSEHPRRPAIGYLLRAASATGREAMWPRSRWSLSGPWHRCLSVTWCGETQFGDVALRRFHSSPPVL